MLDQQAQHVDQPAQALEIVAAGHVAQHARHGVVAGAGDAQAQRRAREQWQGTLQLGQDRLSHELGRELQHRGHRMMRTAAPGAEPGMRHLGAQQHQVTGLEGQGAVPHETQAATRFDPCQLDMVVAVALATKRVGLEVQVAQ